MVAKKTTKKVTKKPKPRPKLKAVPDEEEDKPADPTTKVTKKALAKRPKPPQLRKAEIFKPDMSKLVPLAEKNDFLRVIMYGRQGVGKTSSVMTLANRGKVVAVDPEGSLKRAALREMDVNTDNILLWPDWSYDDLQQLYVTVKAQLEEEPGSIFAVVIDTATALSHFWLEETVRNEIARPGMQRKHPDRTVFDVYQDDYGTLAEMFKTLITRQLFLLDCHVVVVCHSREGEDETGAVRVGPALSPAAQSALLTYADWTLRMHTDTQGQRWTQAHPSGRYEAKDRYGCLPEKTRNATLLQLFEVWEEQASNA